MTIKLCDFGLAKNLYGGYKYRIKDMSKRLPLKWMAIESFDRNLFTTKSDVWSFSITCWEIFTLGMDPYLGVDYTDLCHIIREGYRLDQPGFCPNAVFALMKECWNEFASERPSFADLVASFETLTDTESDSARADSAYADSTCADSTGVSFSRANSEESTAGVGYVTVMRASSV